MRERKREKEREGGEQDSHFPILYSHLISCHVNKRQTKGKMRKRQIGAVTMATSTSVTSRLKKSLRGKGGFMFLTLS